PLGLTLAGLPEFRYDYMKAMVRARLEHPERLPAYNPEKDADHVKEWPGFLPYAIAEHFAKLQSSFNTLRILESVKEKVGERDASISAWACGGGGVLGALYSAAWEASKPTDREVAAFLRYSERGRRPTGSEPETPAPPAPPPTAP